MAKDTNGAQPVTRGVPRDRHDQDLVVVEVLWSQGIGFKDDGKVYPKGATLTMRRGVARQQNTPGRQAIRILSTARYHLDAEFTPEEELDEGPLEITGG